MPLTPGDLAQIHDLYGRYNHAVDGGDGEAYANCFLDDGVIDIGGGPVEGRAALAKVPRWVGRNLPGVRHFVSNVIADADPADRDRAFGQAYILVYAVEKGSPPAMRSSGRYKDVLRRTMEGWRFERRDYTAE